MDTFSLDQLSEVQFEEFCYDLLVNLGAKEIGWRKGTGLSSSPADQGRDIECYFVKRDPDGAERRERWFVECKHYKQGVPPDRISGALAWANAERPDVLLLIASNAFSNPCKTFLHQIRENNRPPFQIKVWEIKDLENLTFTRPHLLRKYGLSEAFPFLKLLHPAHVMFLRNPPLNTLKFFFDALEKAGPHRFREALTGVSFLILKPTVSFPTDPNETLRDLIQSPVGYVDFRKHCYELAHVVEEPFLVRAIVNEALSAAFQPADKTDLDRVSKNNEALIEDLEVEKAANPDDTQDLSHIINEIKKRTAELPDRCEESYKTYVAFCEEVVAPLFKEEIKFPPEVSAFVQEHVRPLKRHTTPPTGP